jgi:hypothetical protein
LDALIARLYRCDGVTVWIGRCTPWPTGWSPPKGLQAKAKRALREIRYTEARAVADELIDRFRRWYSLVTSHSPHLDRGRRHSGREEFSPLRCASLR